MANRIKGITVEIGGDTTKLTNSLKIVNDENTAALFGARTSTEENKLGVFLTSATQVNGQFATESIACDVDDYTRLDKK